MDNDVIEGYLIRSGITYEVLGDGMWILHDEFDNVENIVVTHADPVVIFRVKLMELPQDAAKKAELFRKLLELNVTEMLSGAYGIDGNAVVALETLQAENLDLNEFQAAIDGLTMAITDHYDELKRFHDGADSQAAN
ncbi:MAG: hypothetical protein EP329_20170 [Deltaproteobacteria bacterium]|nr:MAG: hypothetical protein EP329_20170 [Deltaproteobacteria bacterium]